jgi:hypothetical protein
MVSGTRERFGYMAKPCFPLVTTPPLASTIQQLLQKNAPERLSDTDAPPSSDPGDPDLRFPQSSMSE